jgi:hypothetical protein
MLSRWFQFFLAVTTLATAPAALAAPPEDAPLVYGGRLVDESGRPVTGIFPLTFSIYPRAGVQRASWTDSNFVAVDNGVYAVELGKNKPLPKRLDLDKAEIGITVTGRKGDIVREPLRKAAAPADGPVVDVKPVGDPSTGVRPSAANQQTYADVAGYAYEAERARVADRVGSMTEADLKALAKNNAKEAAPAGGAKARVGSTKQFTESAGGPEGRPYSITCPPGYVVVGIRGGAGALVDSISLVCSPLE